MPRHIFGCICCYNPNYFEYTSKKLWFLFAIIFDFAAIKQGTFYDIDFFSCFLVYPALDLKVSQGILLQLLP